MLQKRLVSLFFGLLLSFLFLAPPPIHGADATSFDPTKVAVTAKGAGIPVGMIFAWPVGKNPEDMAAYSIFNRSKAFFNLCNIRLSCDLLASNISE